MGCRAAVEAVLKAVRARDADKLRALVAPGVGWQVGHWEGDPRVISGAELGEFVDALARHDDRTRVEEVVEIAGAVIVRHVVEVRKPPGTPYGGTQFALFECRDGLVSSRRTFAYRADVLDALGLTRADRQGVLVIRDDADDRLYHCNIERGSSVRRGAYSELGSSDHDHCELCWAKFMADAWPGVRLEGYAVEAGRFWLCRDCYDEVKDHLALTERP